MFRACLAALSVVTAAPAVAQTAIDCTGWQASAQNIPEPWQANTRTFANGDVRVALLDTIEPAAGAFYLMVLAPPLDELGGRSCAIIAEAGGDIGFAGLFFDRLGAVYDPASGLTLRLPVSRFVPETGGFDPAVLAVTVNQATGRITPRFESP